MGGGYRESSYDVFVFFPFERTGRIDQAPAWIQLWNKAGFDAIETMLRGDKNRRGFCYGSSPTIADAYLVSQVFSAVRFKTDMNPYPEIRAVVENCNTLRPFADAHPSKQPDAAG